MSMRVARELIRRQARARCSVRITGQQRSKSGFDLKLNGRLLAHFDRFNDALGALYRRLYYTRRHRFEITKGGVR